MWLAAEYDRHSLFFKRSSHGRFTYISPKAYPKKIRMEKDRIDDSSFVVITGPPQKDKSKRISHVRSVIRKSQLRRHGQLQARPVARNKSQQLLGNGLGSPGRQLTWKMDLSWLTVSETVSKRLRYCTLPPPFGVELCNAV
jgi:hypothetical protein